MTENTRFSQDSLFDGRLFCMQHRQGYRFSLDSILLAHFITLRAEEKVLDLGGGCGVISLILAYRYPQIRMTVLELQADLADLIKMNIAINEKTQGNYQARTEVILGDLCRIDLYIEAGSFDWIVCNPPYRKSGSGRVNPASEEAIARHEVKTDLPAIIRACTFGLRTRGRCALIYPASRGVSLFYEMRRQGLEPKRLRVVYGYPGSEAKLWLIEAVKGGNEELLVEPPFYVYKERNGEYSEAMSQFYKP